MTPAAVRALVYPTLIAAISDAATPTLASDIP
jgi:hypothetical protein